MSCKKGVCLPSLQKALWVDGWTPRRSSVTRNACVGEWRGNRGYILLINPLFIDNV